MATANAFALLDDEGTLDAGALAAKLTIESAEKKAAESKQQGMCSVYNFFSSFTHQDWEMAAFDRVLDLYMEK
jgi:hypothetical protein